ncbi:MAG: HAD-IIIA family hydrolase [Lewinellaceae bacterium]|jgi:D-glycero-D-manno-heptose 1,7-bisphosphate phosphatase|nr:HAD-IIIA family hydrolase [Lewinellaceae bacterium]
MSTLFLDRDGVINLRVPGEYINTPEAFIPAEGLGEAMQLLSGLFDRILVVTNQAGIGRGLMTESDLAAVHQKMANIVESAGGRIDGVYYCPHAKDAGCSCRKPATGMAWKAMADFPDTDFSKAWIAGDSVSDMAFGNTLGMRTVLIRGKEEEAAELAAMAIDFQFDSLLHFARYMAGC